MKKPLKKLESAHQKAHSYAKELTSSQKKRLRGLAHGLKALVQIGAEGITPGIAGAVQAALLTHELVKVQTQGNSSATEKDAEAIALLKALRQGLHSRVHVVGRIGRMLILYFEKNPAEALLPLKSLLKSQQGRRSSTGSQFAKATDRESSQASIT